MPLDETKDAYPLALPVTPLFDLIGAMDGFDFVTFSVGPAEDIYILAVTSPKDYGDDWKAQTPHDFAVFRWDGATVTRFDIPDQHWNYHFVQPLPNNELLLAVARSQYRGADDYDLNAKVFAADGTLVREFLLGDGLSDVQTTANGIIWSGYHDEGVFGNYGWGRGAASRPVGSSGLVVSAANGTRLFAYDEVTPTAGFQLMSANFVPQWEGAYVRPDAIPLIDDCYALNVASESETWLCYYSHFPLVRLRGRQAEAMWSNPIYGANVFAIDNDSALFNGGYREHHMYRLFALNADGTMTHRATLRPTEDGSLLPADSISGRGDTIYFRVGLRFYYVTVQDALNVIGAG